MPGEPLPDGSLPAKPLPGATRPQPSKTQQDGGPVTLRMVAETAGVSVSTASRSLNGQARRYRISRATEKSVREIAARLGFRPSLVARSLRLKQSALIGVIVPDLSNPFFAAIAREVSLGVEKQGFSVLLGDSREETLIERRLAEELRARQVEALFVCPVGTDPSHLLDLNREGLPVVVADRVFPNTDLDSVTSDNVRSARELAGELVAAGHRKIGVLAGLQGSLPTQQRLQGLREALNEVGVGLPNEAIAGNAYTIDSGFDGTNQLLRQSPDMTALFAMCVPAAIGALRAVDQFELKIPTDLSVVSFDEHPYADLMRTPLTASVQDVKAIGSSAAEVILMRTRPPKEDNLAPANPAPGQNIDAQIPPPYFRRMIPAILRQRGSVAPPSADTR